jgi:hypothetical protein
VKDIAAQYQARRDVLYKGLTELGWAVDNPKASMYIWARIPEHYRALGSLEFAKRLLERAKVCVSPGIGFGDHGDDHVRFRVDRKRGADPPGGARHQGDVQGRWRAERLRLDRKPRAQKRSGPQAAHLCFCFIR